MCSVSGSGDAFYVTTLTKHLCLCTVVLAFMTVSESPRKRPRAVTPAEEEESARMCEFIRKGFEHQPFKEDKALDGEILKNIEWTNSRTADETIAFRTKVSKWVGKLGKQLRESGEADRWLASADPIVKKVSAGVNGPLMEVLAQAINYHDPEVVELFRTGAPLVRFSNNLMYASRSLLSLQVGPLAQPGNGPPDKSAQATSIAGLTQSRASNNAAILSRLREDEHSGELKELGELDAGKKRMSDWAKAGMEDLCATSLSPRFGVAQGQLYACSYSQAFCFSLSGKKPDGTPKIRAVDDLSRSGINDATAPAEHPVCDTIDTLRNSMRALRVARSKKVVMYQYVSGKFFMHGALQAPERIMHTFKADIDSAFRRIPIMPGG